MTRPSLTLVREIADDTNADPATLEPPLHHVIDPDALDALVDSTPDGSAGQLLVVRFRYQGYDVAVLDDGTIELDGREVDAST